MNHINRVSLTPTVARQTQQTSFGEHLRNGLGTAGQLMGTTLMGALPGAPIVSAAISSVTSLASQRSTAVASAATAVMPGGQAVAVGSVGTVSGGSVAGASLHGGSATTATLLDSATSSGDPSGMVRAMRQEADRSMAVQMQMQQESREYNTLTNVLKVRHDSAKAAINNVR